MAGATIDGHDRAIVGWAFALRGRTQETERALDMVCLTRFGTLRPTGAAPLLRSDTELVFLSPALSCGLHVLSALSGVHRALHAGAEQSDRALPSEF
jgi:hypothetical protein